MKVHECAQLAYETASALCGRRVNVAQLQVYEYLYRTNPFTYAIEQPNTNEKLFHAVIVGLEEDALARHLAWGKEADFYLYEYNYRSSMATAIHFRIRKVLGIDEAKIPMLEHKRWNAYMRTTGYCNSGSRDKSSRNDLAKLHPDLVPFGALSKEDIDKDIRVGTK